MHPEKAYLPLELARKAAQRKAERLEQGKALAILSLAGFGVLFVLALLGVLL
jgi:hypothetical protein